MRLTLLLGLAVLTMSPLSSTAFGQRLPNRPNRPGPGASASVEIITRTINDCEDRCDRFVRTLRRALNISGLNGTNREDDLNRAARKLENSMDDVGKSWNRDKDVSKTRRHVREAISSARNIDITMRNRRLHPEAEQQWREVRTQINLLARAFKLPTVNW